MDEMMTAEEAAALLGVTASRIRQMIMSDQLHPIKRAGANFFYRTEVEQFTQRPKPGRPRRKPDRG